MFTMVRDIRLGGYRLGMLESVEIKRSVETLADTAVIKLPATQYNSALEVEDKLKRGDEVSISLGYDEIGMNEEFTGYIQRIGTDNGAITIECEDELYKMRKSLSDRELKSVTLKSLLNTVLSEIGGGYTVDSTYSWTYEKFVIKNATAYDVLKKVQEESGADIYLVGNTLHLHAPGEKIGEDRYYDFARNLQKCDLKYRSAADRKVRVVVKALQPDGKVKQIEVGATGGEKLEVKCVTSDSASMKQRGDSEVLRHSFDGYEGHITSWLFPVCNPGDSAVIHDADYAYKDGKYFVKSVTTTFGSGGASRKIELGFKLS